MTQSAFLGTGLLGAAFVEAACARGESVTAWNRTPAKARALEAFGARAAATPADAVRGAARVHLVLRDDAVVEEVIAAVRGALAPDALILDHTTTQPALTAARARQLAAEGVRYLHCPVFIGPPAARRSEGIILASGARALFDAARPALEPMCTRLEYLGERPDLAATYKLCGNAFILGIASLVADVLAIGAGGGLTPQETLKVQEFINPVGIIANRGRKMAAGDHTATFELTMARKDLRLMLETAGGRPMAMLPGLAARMDEIIAEGYGHEDLGAIARGVIAP